MNAKHGRDQHKIAQGLYCVLACSGRCSGISLRTPKQAKSYIMACIAKIHMGGSLRKTSNGKEALRFWIGVKWCETWAWCWMARSSFVFHCLSIHALEGIILSVTAFCKNNLVRPACPLTGQIWYFSGLVVKDSHMPVQPIVLQEYPTECLPECHSATFSSKGKGPAHMCLLGGDTIRQCHSICHIWHFMAAGCRVCTSTSFPNQFSNWCTGAPCSVCDYCLVFSVEPMKPHIHI